MNQKIKLWKTTLIIWSRDDPRNMEIDTLSQEAVEGISICTVREDILLSEDACERLDFFNLNVDSID